MPLQPRIELQASLASLLLALPANLSPADTVTLAPASRGGVEYRVDGRIVDYRGDVIVLQRPGGSQKSYPSERVVGVQTVWPEAYGAAQRSIKNRAWAAAASELDAAIREEKRRWARRQMLADLMRCQMSLGQWERAGQLMILLADSDPQTPAWASAPLPWFASTAVRPAVAQGWIAHPTSEAAQLLGAAWLLNTPQQAEAEPALKKLRLSTTPALASLAAGQLWRTQLLGVTPQKAELWRQQIEPMPPPLRAGPRHVLAQAWRRLARYDAAMLAALEGPLTGAAPRELSARGLVLAGRAAAKAGHSEEARRLWNEVRKDYADTPQLADAESLLSKL